MKENPQTICAVVVTFNRLQLLKECIHALRSQTRKIDKILVVNNNSTDGTRDWLEAQADLWVINQENLGSAGGFNRAIKEAYNSKYDSIWVMDDDVIPDFNALLQLCNQLVSLPHIGFVSSLVLSEAGDVINVPTIDMRRGDTGYSTWCQHLDRGVVKVRESTYVSLLIPSHSIKNVGLPIKELYIWGDDTEFTRRITTYRESLIVGSSHVVHKRAQNSTLNIITDTNQQRLRFYYYLYRNMMFLRARERELLPLAVFVIKSLIQAIKCFRAVDFKLLRFRMIILGLLSGFVFSPSIETVSDLESSETRAAN